MEDARTSTSSQSVASTFVTLIESPGADITAIPIVKLELLPTGNNKEILVSVPELFYGSNAAGVGTSAKSLDRKNKLISSSEEFYGPKKYGGPSEGLHTHVFQRKSPTDKSLFENTKLFARGPEEEVGPKEEQQPCGSSSSPQKQ
ncbi:hypothetical protein O181_079667 [Austropuccinia psidii MF-1]|uniref:Uncharacterized protein n=1 Tax=Austropuccinia psidii MF-1 TaxID=1389203 RepID=A0A9Q3IGR3_9BASI|nr:hypothetical protein [Austropuccinia psidii MF-1]